MLRISLEGKGLLNKLVIISKCQVGNKKRLKIFVQSVNVFNDEMNTLKYASLIGFVNE